ncbi:phage tail tape measure protein, TP901 family, core region [Variovorax sp. PBS-H4]|uniref:phage tail tape measure protein n=1 Tax=Variovorax sp. PBS-H4 TaxID=434008 RepID=UPI0013184D27|nr:phage tail tape measure protein [Variovorax sp. PBS-H4]VTU32289.1 phage tail tape measure protein, TP901 family, core region [Variovorax sp. PBS-H4]
MSDDIKIGLDGKPLENAAKPALEALKQLQVAVERLDQASLKRLNKETQGLVTSLKSLASSTSADMQKFVSAVGSSIERAAREAKPKADAAGKSIGKFIASSIEEETSRVKISIGGSVDLGAGLKASIRARGAEAAQEVRAELAKIANSAEAVSALRAGSAPRLDPRTLLGLPSRDKMKSIGAEIAAQMRESVAIDGLRERSASNIDPRTLLGLPSRDKMKSMGAEIAAQMREGVATDALRAKSATNIDARTLLGLPKEKDARAIGAEIAAQMRAGVAAEQSRNASISRDAAFNTLSPAGQVSRATRVASAVSMGMSEAEATTRYGAAAVSAAQNIDRLRAANEGLRASQDNVHASARAMASGQREVHSAIRGVAGAADALFLTYGSLLPLTATFFATTAVKEAIQAYKDLEYQIKFVRALEEDGGKGLTERAMRLQTGDIAVGSGVDPVEASKGLRLLAQSGLNAQEALGALPAVLKTARVGELGVAEATETLTGQVHAFGLQMDDIGRVGDVMAKAGAISNTSVSKMSESMKQASTIAQQYGLKIEEVSTILVALAKRNITGSSAGTATANLFRELGNPHGREAKQIAKDLGITLWDPLDKSRKDFFDRFVPELRKNLEVLDPESQSFVLNRLTNNRGEKALGAILGLTDEALGDIKSKLESATGFVDTANAKLMDSVQGDMDRLKATFTNALAEAGSAGAGDFRSALQGLQAIVGSPEFQQGLSGLVKGIAAIANVSVTAAQWVGELYGWLQKLFVLPEFVKILGDLYEKLKDPSGTNAAISQGNAYIASLDTQIAKVRQLAAEKARADGTASPVGLASLRKTRDDAEAALKAARGGDDLSSHPGLRAAQESQRAVKMQVAQAAYDQAQAKLMEAHNKNIQLIKETREYNNSFEKTVTPGNALGTGTRHYEIPPKVNAGAARRAADEDYKNEKKRLDLLSAGNRLLVEQTDTESKEREAALQQSYDRGVIDFKTYQQKLSEAQQEQATIRINLAEAESNAIKAGLSVLRSKAEAQKKAGKADVDDALSNEIQAQTNKYLQAQQNIAKLVSEQKARAEKSLTDALKPASEILKNSEKESAVEDERMRQEMEKLRVKGSGLELSEREQFIQSEILRILGEQEKKLSSAQAIMQKMTEDGVFKDADTNPEVRAVRDRLQGYIDSKRSTIDAARPAITDAAGNTFDGKRWTGIADRLASSTEGAIKDGLNAAFTGDTTALKNFGKTLQKTVAGAVVDAFYDVFVKDAVKGLARDLMNSLRGAASGGSSSSGSGLGSLIGAAVSLFGGGGATAAFSQTALGASGFGSGLAYGNLDLGLALSGGGYTGPGGKYEPKGVVHGGEFVINKESTSKLGLGFLNSLNQFADGGYVPLTSGPSMLSNPAARVSDSGGQSIVYSPTTHVSVDSRSDRAAVIQDVQRVVSENQKNFVEQLKRVKVLPA